MPADILPINGLQPGVALRYNGFGSGPCDDGVDMGGIDPRDFGALESEVKHLRHQLTEMTGQIAAVSRQMDSMERLLAQLQGARWTLATLAAIAGAGAGLVTWIAGWFKFGPSP